MSKPDLKLNSENLAPDPNILLDTAVSLVRDDLDSVNNTIQSRIKSDIALINTLGAYIVKSGGKRLRPLILLLCWFSLQLIGASAMIL